MMEINGYLINELTQGMEMAKQLRTQLGPEYSPQTNQILLQQIVSSYDKALVILGCGSHTDPPHHLTAVASNPRGDDQTARSNSVCSLKRKSASTDDGYSWRKYGQKEILGTKYPRSYYRCTYRNARDCWATKQVQRTGNDPTVFDIIYRGEHTCDLDYRFKTAPLSSVKQEPKQEQPDCLILDTFANVGHQQHYLDGGIGDVVLGATSSNFSRHH